MQNAGPLGKWALGMICAAAAFGARAQDAAETPVIPLAAEPAPPLQAAPQPEADTPVQLEEIVVTATKRSKSLREIPSSISSQSGEDLEKRGAQGAEDIVKTVPGVNFSSEPINAARITIRGISTGALSNPTTGSLFGDVSFTDAYIPRVTLDPNPFDLQSVEVLKGPQGTLFGAAALNGAIRYVPEQPVFGSFEGRWFAQYSQVSQGDAAPVYGAVVNVPYGDTLALRVMAFDRHSPGYVDDIPSHRQDINEVKQQGLRSILGWQPNEAWDVKLTYAWQRTDSPDTPITDNTDGELSRSFVRQKSPIMGQYGFTDLNLRYHYDWADLVAETAYVRKSAEKHIDASRLLSTQIPVLEQPDYSLSRTYSQEVRLVSPDGSDSPWSWAAGVFVSRQEVFFDTGYSLTTLPGLPVARLRPLLDALFPGLGGEFDDEGRLNLLRVVCNALVQEQAVFGDLTRRFGDNWELSAGGRYYRTRSGGTLSRTGALVATGGRLENGIDADIEESGFNPKLSLMWRANENASLYGAASRGFRVGGIQPGFTAQGSAHQAPDVFKSDSLWNYEAGLRTQWLQKTLRADITAFYIDWRDPQLLQNGSPVPIPFLDNVGGVESKGLEGSLQWLFPFLPGLAISAGGSYMKTVTTKTFTTADGSDSVAGTPWPFAPEAQTATTLRYGRPAGDWNLDAAVTHVYIGKANATLKGDFQVFGYQQWDLLLNVANPAIAWLPQMTLSVNNLLDERGITSGGPAGVVTKVVEAIYIQPRTVTLRLEGRF